MYKWDTLLESFTVDFLCVIFLYQKVVSKIDPTLFFVLNFHEQTAINFRTIIESWQWSWFFSCVLKNKENFLFEINDQKLY